MSKPRLPQNDERLEIRQERIRLHRPRRRAAVEHPGGGRRLERRRGFRGPERAHAAGQLGRPARSRASPASPTSATARATSRSSTPAACALRDSSGDIEIDEVRRRRRGGRSTARATSASRTVGGSVAIEQDSSGGMRVEDVKGSVDVDSDSSGDIYAGRVKGDFTVSEDSSGSHRTRIDRRQGHRAEQQARRRGIE